MGSKITGSMLVRLIRGHPPYFESVVVHIGVAEDGEALRGTINLVQQPVALVDVCPELELVFIVVMPE